MVFGDTIAAVATAPGAGGVAIVRISGSEAFAVARALCGREPAVGRAVLVKLAVDRPLMLAFAAPRSYTGEDTVEFHCHGGIVTPRRVLELALAAGARLARRGEFTQRAFLNGKLDYEAAEGVLSLVNARTDRAADAALAGLGGRGGGEKRRLYEAALALSADIEHSLDVDESELPEGFFKDAAERAGAIASGIRLEVRRLNESRLLNEGALVVLAGAPNTGKSSLMNALLGRSRAIVSDVAGTTRDSIEEWLDIEGFPVRLVDTAGLRETENEIEAEGVERSRRLIGEAEVVLRLVPGGGADVSPKEIAVSSKCDIARGEGLNVSAVTGEGIGELRREIARRLEAVAETGAQEDSAGVEEGFIRAGTLADECVRRAGAEDAVLLGNAARMLAEELGAMTGAVYSEDVLDRLFSRFCVGK